MNSKWKEIERRQSLRTEAESLIVSLSPETMNARPVEALVHELMVHKIELEMQNEELRRTQDTLEEALERYRDLYEFAPVGYITIDPDGLISDINLTGSGLLGVARDAAINKHFATFIAPQDRDLWHRLFVNLMEHANGEQQAIDLKLARVGGAVFCAHLDCLCKKLQDTASPILRVALSDNGGINPTENK